MDRRDVLQLLQNQESNAALRNEMSSISALQAISFWNAIDNLRSRVFMKKKQKAAVRSELISRYAVPTSAFYKSTKPEMQRLLDDYAKTESDSTLSQIHDELLGIILEALYEHNAVRIFFLSYDKKDFPQLIDDLLLFPTFLNDMMMLTQKEKTNFLFKK
jgi:hypothetical protein